jgi:hypothetical protein
MSFYKKLKKEDITIVFEELPSLPLLESEIITSVSITVYSGKSIIARYYKELKYELNDIYFYLLTQMFLGNARYRKSMQHIGEWDSKYKVSTKRRCLKAISSINQLENPTLQDYVNLQTFGRDLMSIMTKDELIPSLPNFIVARIEKEFSRDLDGEKLMLTALIWVARGLTIENAINKVRFDEGLAKIVAERYE